MNLIVCLQLSHCEEHYNVDSSQPVHHFKLLCVWSCNQRLNIANSRLAQHIQPKLKEVFNFLAFSFSFTQYPLSCFKRDQQKSVAVILAFFPGGESSFVLAAFIPLKSSDDGPSNIPPEALLQGTPNALTESTSNPKPPPPRAAPLIAPLHLVIEGTLTLVLGALIPSSDSARVAEGSVSPEIFSGLIIPARLLAAYLKILSIFCFVCSAILAPSLSNLSVSVCETGIPEMFECLRVRGQQPSPTVMVSVYPGASVLIFFVPSNSTLISSSCSATLSSGTRVLKNWLEF